MRLESGEVLVDAGGRHGNIGKGGDGAGEGNPGATYRCLHKRLRPIDYDDIPLFFSSSATATTVHSKMRFAIL